MQPPKLLQSSFCAMVFDKIIFITLGYIKLKSMSLCPTPFFLVTFQSFWFACGRGGNPIDQQPVILFREWKTTRILLSFLLLFFVLIVSKGPAPALYFVDSPQNKGRYLDPRIMPCILWTSCSQNTGHENVNRICNVRNLLRTSVGSSPRVLLTDCHRFQPRCMALLFWTILYSEI